MRISDWSSDVCSSDLERDRAEPVVGVNEHAIARFYHESLVRRAFEVVDDAGSGMAEREIVRRRLGGRIDGVEGERGIVLLQHLAPDQHERHADLRLLARALHEVSAAGEPRNLETT